MAAYIIFSNINGSSIGSETELTFLLIFALIENFAKMHVVFRGKERKLYTN